MPSYLKKNNYRIYIFGGTSFIGFHIALFFYKLFKTTVIVSPNKKKSIALKRYKILKKKKINLVNLNLLKLNDVSHILNCKEKIIIVNSIGWTKNYNSSIYNYRKIKNNYKIFFSNVRRIFDTGNVSFFFEIGSDMEYEPRVSKIIENMSHHPKSKYGKIKLQNTKKIHNLAKTFNINFYIIRVFSIFGFLNRKDNLIESIKQKKKINIKDPYFYKDFIDIKYLPKLIYNCISIKNKKNFTILNFCSSQRISPDDIFNQINKLNLKKLVVNYLKKKNTNVTTKYTIGNNKKLLNILKIGKIYPMNDIINYIKN